MVAQQTLTLLVRVQILLPQPYSEAKKDIMASNPPKSHDFGGFSRVSSLFRNHEVCGYRVQKKRYHFKKTASDRI